MRLAEDCRQRDGRKLQTTGERRKTPQRVPHRCKRNVMTNPFESPSSVSAGVTEPQRSRDCWPPNSARIAVFVAGTSLLPFVWLSTAAIRLGDPQWWSPIPLAFFFPAWISQLFGFIFNGCVLLGSFALFSWPLSDGRPRILRWSLGAVILLQTLNWIYLALVFQEGIRAHGRSGIKKRIGLKPTSWSAFWPTCCGRRCIR